MNAAAGLAATAIPTTVGGAVIKANTVGVSSAFGAVRNATTHSGNSFMTTPVGSWFSDSQQGQHRGPR